MFALYVRGKKAVEWRFERQVSLAGVLAEAISDEAARVEPQDTGMAWRMDRGSLCDAVIRKFGLERNALDCKVLIDATWGRDDALLLEIENVFGYSYDEWTPLMFQLSTAAEVRKRPNGRKTAVEVIHCEASSDGDFIHEFLYLQCGHAKGKGRRTWGMMGYTNAALLWPDAFKHLLSKAGFAPRSKEAKAGR